jgi:hypothetical protein
VHILVKRFPNWLQNTPTGKNKKYVTITTVNLFAENMGATGEF